MAKGDGSISAVKDKDGNAIRNRWRVSLSFGTNPLTGKPNRVTRIVNGTKAEARHMRDDLRKQYDQGLEFGKSQITFSEMSKLWTASRYSTGAASETTIKLDAQRLRHMEALIGHMPLRSITVPILEKAFATVKEKRNLSNTTMHELHGIVKRVFAKAVDYDIILRNPCDKIKAPRKSDPDRTSLKVEDAVKLVTFVDEYEHDLLEEFNQKEERQDKRDNSTKRSYINGLVNISSIMAVRIAIATGMRRGEVLGLMWKDISFGDVCELKVRRAYTPTLKLKEPKTKSGFRTIAVDRVTAEHLKTWKILQAECLKTLGEALMQTEDTPVCCSNIGGLYDPTNFYGWWNAFRKQAGFPKLRFHELRHTQATQLLANGVDVKTVQTRLGHANASITLNWYAHAVPENDQKAAQLIGDLFSSNPQTDAESHQESQAVAPICTASAPTPQNPSVTKQTGQTD